jgi:translation elongation factor EF-4
MANIKTVADTKIGDTITDETPIPRSSLCPASKKSSPWFSPGSTPWTPMNTPSFAKPWKTAPQRFVVLLRTGEFGRTRIRLPLRLSRPAPHGDHQERLEREFNLELITTAPGVRYKITKTDGTLVEVDNPSRWPDPSEIAKVKSR